MLDQLPTLTEQTRTTALSLEQLDFEEACRTMALAGRRPLTLVEQKKRQAALLKARQACNALELADPLLSNPPPPSSTSSKPTSAQSPPPAATRSSSFPNGSAC